MEFTAEEKKKIKTMLLFLVKSKSKATGGHGGFHVNELTPFLEELSSEGIIESRNTINSCRYFIKRRQYTPALPTNNLS